MEYMGGGIAAIPVTPPEALSLAGAVRHRTSLADEAPTPEAMAACAKVKKAENNQLMVAPVVVGQESGVFYIDFFLVVFGCRKNPTQDFPLLVNVCWFSCSVLDDSNMFLILPAAFVHRNDFFGLAPGMPSPPKTNCLRHR